MKTYLPMPTVNQLAQVFKDRGWKPNPERGCWVREVRAGRCCAVPALVALGDPDFLDRWANQDSGDHKSELDIYERVDEIYGPGARLIYSGFDATETNAGDWCDLGATEANARAWYDLGNALRDALELPCDASEYSEPS